MVEGRQKGEKEMYTIMKSKTGETELLYYYGLPVAAKINGTPFAVKYVDNHVAKKVKEWCEREPELKDSAWFTKVALRVLSSVV
jgi:hypothetical protein